MSNLVIVESPTKAKTITKFLGKGWKVESSFGHMRDLPKSKLGVDVENNFEPQYVIPTKARKRVNELKKKAAEADKVILATDEDREGEAISWHLVQALGLDSTERIVFHEITKKAIEEALKNPRDIDFNLVDAQQARRVLDRLVGYNLSPFLWQKVARGLSAGRVQSIAVRLIVDREEEREKFKKEEYWTIIGKFEARNSCLSGRQAKSETPFEAQLVKIAGKPLEKFDIKTEKDAKAITDKLKNAEAKVISKDVSLQEKHSPAPFITSTLQQTAFQRLRLSAKQTMSLAQRLYEVGLITYMRTDSFNLSQEAVAEAANWIIKNLGERYVLKSPRKFKTKSKVAQEAHEAIRPTEVSKTPDTLKGSLDAREWRIYDLIWRRFVATQLPSAAVENTRVDINAADHTFRASGARLAFDGFLKIYTMKFSENMLPELKKDDTLETKAITPLQHFTQPPPRYNEASLIKILEQYGIGRPSTYAPTLATIQDRGYVEKDPDRRLLPTETGKIVNKILVEHFPKIVDVEFTARMEEDLDEVAGGKKKWQPLIGEFYGPFAENLKEKYDTVPSQKIEEKTDEVCPNCGKPMVIKRGRFGKFIACSGFPECKTTKRIPDPALNIKCPKCVEGDVVRRRSKRGRYFFGCSRWPDCDFVAWKLETIDTKKEGEETKTKENI